MMPDDKTRAPIEPDVAPDDAVNNPVDPLDAIYQDAAMLDFEQGTSTPEDRGWADGVRDRIQARLAELRRNRLPPDVERVPARPIRPAFLAMARDALLALIDEISRRMGGTVQLAHRNLSTLSDDDLRRLLETISDPE